MSGVTLSRLERLHVEPADATFQMDHNAFHTLYERTARPIWAYLWRRTGDAQLADDLLQETYYRFLRARSAHASETHQRNYLFRIAANLVNDNHRNHHAHVDLPGESEQGHPAQDQDAETRSQQRADLDRALAKMSAKQRDALWLAYAEGSSHSEIACRLGVTQGSVKLILFRARRKLARLLQKGAKS